MQAENTAPSRGTEASGQAPTTAVTATRTAAATGMDEIRAAITQPEDEQASEVTLCSHIFCNREAGCTPASARWVVGDAEEQQRVKLCIQCMAEIQRAGEELTAECCEQCSILEEGMTNGEGAEIEKGGDTASEEEENGASENERHADSEVASITREQQPAEAGATAEETGMRVNVRIQEVVKQALETAETTKVQTMRLSDAENRCRAMGLLGVSEIYEHRERVAQHALTAGRKVIVQGLAGAHETVWGARPVAATAKHCGDEGVPPPSGPPPSEGKQAGKGNENEQARGISMVAKLHGIATQNGTQGHTPEERTLKRRCPFEECGKLVTTTVARGDGPARACSVDHYIQAQKAEQKVRA